jgi:hypothetical protein
MQDDLDRLIDELLKRELRPNIREDLGTFRRQFAAGTLAADDARYVRALHARLVKGGVPKAEPKRDDGEAALQPSEVERLQAALAEAQRRERALEAERDRLQSELGSLRKEIEALKAAKS